MSTRQFESVSCRYGSPMGRHCVPDLKKTRKSIRLFRVRLDSGGYDDGGAYWGARSRGVGLYCARDSEGDVQTVEAGSRVAAAFALDIPLACLAARIPYAEIERYCYALFDGRAPYPKGKDAADVHAWLALTPDLEN